MPIKKEIPLPQKIYAIILTLSIAFSISCRNERSEDSNNNGVTALNYPFPQHYSYTTGCIKPNHKTQNELDDQIKNYYDYWKSKYLVNSTGTTNGYLIQYVEKEDQYHPYKTVSEAHGYGMIIVVLMAGYDNDAKKYFNGMIAFYNDHRSVIDNDLMDWAIDWNETPGGDEDSATDGDLDIAYALILAHLQWGSDNSINYLAEARRIIENGLKQSCISNSTYNRLLGDWIDENSETYNKWTTRSSDWMADHCRVFGTVTSDQIFWNNVVERIYSNISSIQNNHSPNTGLIPDFIINTSIDPAGANFLESQHDGHYFYNACRWPWRTAMDYAHYGEIRAHNSLNILMNWIGIKTNNDPSNIKAGYELDGNVIGDYSEGCFIAPFAAASIINSNHQGYLNKIWDIIVNLREDYYSDTINLMCQIFISGNWWKPTL